MSKPVKRSKQKVEAQENMLARAKVHPELKRFFGYCFVKSALGLRLRFSDQMAEFGLLMPHFGLLSILLGTEQMNQNALAESIHCDKATMVKFIDVLEKASLVERSADATDRRVKWIRITPKGRQMQAKLVKLVTATEEDYFANLTADERSALRSIIPKLLS